MRDFPFCFGESGVQIADSTSSSNSSSSSCDSPNSVTCLYQTHLLGLVKITWTRSLMGPCLALAIDDCKVEIKLSLFSKKKGSKSLHLPSTNARLFWSLSAARFVGGAPEPIDGFYVALVVGGESVLLLGDLCNEARKRIGSSSPAFAPVLLSKREHVSGKRAYSTRAQFGGESRDISIECGAAMKGDPCLEVKVDGEIVMHVKRLAWKFRGNQTILVDGVPVEVFWDVHNWLFGGPAGSVAVFMFRSSVEWSGTPVVEDPWEEGLDFSLLLYAWRNE